MKSSRSRESSVDQDSMASAESGSEAESLSSSVEMDTTIHSDSRSRLEVSSAVCASSEGDTSSVDTPIVKASDPGRGPSVANIKIGPFRPRAKELPGLKYPSRSQGSRQHSFHEKWYDEFDWLEYSIELDAAFCYYCRLRGSHMSGTQSDPSFIIHGNRNWKECPNSFRKHASSEFHKTYVHWIQGQRMQTAGDSVAKQLSRQYRKEVQENRRNVRKILEIVQLFCKQNIPFRGHNESEQSSNRGNYLEILHWIAKDSPELKRHLEKLFHYTSPESQNEMIQLLGLNVQKQIVMELKEAGPYALIADETIDISR